MYGEQTAKRQYSEYSEFCFTQRESEYDIETDTRKWEPSMSRKKKSLVKENNPMYLEGVRTMGEVGLGRPSDTLTTLPGWQ